MPSVPRSSDDVDDVDDVPLPPLDDEGDDAPLEGDDEEIGDYDGASDLDDSVAADLDVGIDLDDVEQALGEDGEAAAQLDVGALDEDLVSGDDEPGGDEEGHGGEEDDDLDELDDGPDDGGAEGTLDAIEDDVDDAALPALDGSSGGDDDDDGQHDDEALIGEAIRSTQVVDLPARDAEPWEVHVGAGARVPCVAVVAHAGRALAGGDVLLLVEDGESSAKRAGLGWSGRAVSVAMSDGVLAVGTARGAVSALAGEARAPLTGWRGRGTPVRLAATPRRLWILAEERLHCSASDGAPVALDLAAPVLAMAASAGTLLVLAGGDEAAVHKVRGDDETPARVAVPDLDPGALQDAGAHLAAAAAGEALAVGTAAGELRISRDGGVTFTAHHLPALHALGFAGDGRDSDLVALVDGGLAGDDFWLLRIAASGAVTRLLALEGNDEEQEPAAEAASLCWDAARELCWMASARGLLAVGRATKH